MIKRASNTMRDDVKSKAELLQEVETLRRRVAELEQSEDVTEHKRAEKALEAERGRLYSLLDALPAFVYLQAPDYSVRFANRYFREHFGEPEGKPCYEVLWGAKEPCKLCPTFKVFETNKPQVWEWSQSPDGRIYEIWDYPFADVDGSPLVLELGVDITEHKQAEEVLRKNKRFLEDIFDAIQDGVSVLDRDLNIVRVNPWMEKMYADRMPLVGKKCYTAYQKRKSVCPWCPSVRAIKAGVTQTEIVPYPCADKATGWIELSAFPLKDADGKLTGVIEHVKDITERKKAEEELRAFEERFSSLAERSFDLIFMTDAQGYLMYVSGASEKILHYKPEEMVGTHFKNYLIKSEIPRVSQRFAENMKGRNLGIFQMEAMRKDKSHVFIELNSAPILKDGETIGIQGIIRDITERKQAEEVLLFKSTLLEAQSETSIDGILVVDSEGKSISFNKNFGRMWNIPQQILDSRDDEKMLQYVLSQLKNPEQFLEKVRYLYAHKNEKSRDEIQFKDGRVFDRYSSLLLDSNDKYYGRVWYFRDVTEHKKAEEELRESEERFRTIFDNAPDGLLVADTESKKIYTANKAFCQMLGYNQEELKNLGIVDIHPKKDLPYVMEQFEKQARGEFTLGRDIPVKRKDGSVFYADINSFPITLAGKSYLTGVFRDITERKKAEEALRESENKYRTLVENLPQKIFLKDRNSVYVSCNDNLARDFKIKSEEIAGKTDYDLVPKELAEKYRADDKRIIESGETEAIVEKYIQEGEERIIHTVKTPVKDEQGNVIGVLGIFWDITELKQTEEELSKYREKIAHAERLASLGTLSATLAHRLNSPLTAISLSIENSLADLETTSCPDTVTEELKDGLSGVSDVASIVDSFRNFAKKSSEKIVSEVNLKAVAERIVRLLNESARRAGVSLHLKGMDELPSIYSNEKDLEQLFFALIENAIQAADGKESRQLIIDGDVKDEHIELRFADNCGGIAPENLDKIFEPFFTTRPAGEGTGLGLCVVEHIVFRAGGKVRVASKAGEGSTFLVTLPINKSKRS